MSGIARCIVLLCLSGAIQAAEQPLELSLSEVEYGLARLRWNVHTGSYLNRTPKPARLYQETTEIPLSSNLQIIYAMKVHASSGRTIQIFQSLVEPGGERHVAVTSIKNGFRLCNSFHFHEDDKPGEWKAQVSVIGIDLSLEELSKLAEEEFSTHLIFQQVFDVKVPEEGSGKFHQRNSSSSMYACEKRSGHRFHVSFTEATP